MELFRKQETRTYFASITEKIKNEIDKMSDEEISTCDFEEWIVYLYKKYYISPMILFEESTEQTISETTVKRYNQFYRGSPYEQEYFLIDGIRITYKIPFDGDSNLFYLKPSSFIFTRFNVEKIEPPYQDECGKINIAFEYPKKELHDKAEQMQEYVHNQFENEFRNYRTMISNVNNEVATFNNSLKSYAAKCLDERKNKASSFALISKMLEIPLPQSKNAPNSKPICLQRIKRTPSEKPSQKPIPNEYYISDKDYENINNIIMMNGTAMEKTARTYYRNNEEELRDHLLATLNTHYENATGETFRKIGKTDINIEFENKAAFIGECKIWHGEKLFADAVQQVLNYSTWKDVKVSVIVFNKENQSFSGVVSRIDKWVKATTKSFVNKKINFWDCILFRNDMNIDVKLNIMAFDIYVDKTQFQDARMRGELSV